MLLLSGGTLGVVSGSGSGGGGCTKRVVIYIVTSITVKST